MEDKIKKILCEMIEDYNENSKWSECYYAEGDDDKYLYTVGQLDIEYKNIEKLSTLIGLNIKFEVHYLEGIAYRIMKIKG